MLLMYQWLCATESSEEYRRSKSVCQRKTDTLVTSTVKMGRSGEEQCGKELARFVNEQRETQEMRLTVTPQRSNTGEEVGRSPRGQR